MQSPYAPSMTFPSPYAPYSPQSMGGFPGAGPAYSAQAGGMMPPIPQDLFSPGAAPPAQEGGEAQPASPAPGAPLPSAPTEGAGGESGAPQTPSSVYAYKGGFADQNAGLPDGSNGWRNYWIGVGGVTGLYTALAGIAAVRSGHGLGLGTLKSALWPPNIKNTVKAAWSGGNALRKGLLTQHFEVKNKALKLLGGKHDAFKNETDVANEIQQYAKSANILGTPSEEATRYQKLHELWTTAKSDQDASKFADHADKIREQFKEIETKNLKPDTELFKEPITEHLKGQETQTTAAFSEELKKENLQALTEDDKKTRYKNAATALNNWKASVAALYPANKELEKLVFDSNTPHDQIEAARARIEEGIKKLDHTGAKKAEGQTQAQT